MNQINPDPQGSGFWSLLVHPHR